MTLISVIIPAHNAEATILETIESIRQQTFSDLELIVIDDGSTDNTLEQLDKIHDDRLRVFTYHNQGLGAARNRGIERAQGEFIAFIDADDLWTREKLELQLEALRRQPKAGIAYSWTAFVDQKGRFLFAKEPLYFEGDVYLQLLLSCFVASGSNVLIRRRCIDTVGLFDVGLSCAEDWEYWLRAAAHWPFVVVPRYQILYRMSPGSLSSDVEAIEKTSLIVLTRAFRAAPKDLQHRKAECLANMKQYLAFLYLTRTPDPHYRAKAGRRLMDSIRVHPRILLARKTRRLLWTWLLLHLVPSSLASPTVTGLLRLHGRLMMLRMPELRVGSITSRI